MNRLASFKLAFRRHSHDWSGNANSRHDRLALWTNGCAEADATQDGFFPVACNASGSDSFELLKELGSIGNGVFGSAGKTIDLEDLVGERSALKGRNGLAHSAAMRWQNATNTVGH